MGAIKANAYVRYLLVQTYLQSDACGPMSFTTTGSTRDGSVSHAERMIMT